MYGLKPVIKTSSSSKITMMGSQSSIVTDCTSLIRKPGPWNLSKLEISLNSFNSQGSS